MSETTREIREICRSISLGNPKVVSRLQREAELGTINPALLINLIDRGWGRPIPMGAEKPKQDPVLFISHGGPHHPWCYAVDPGREKSARMIADKEAELALESGKKEPAGKVIDPAKPEDEGESVDIPELPELFHPRVRERDRELRGRS